MALSVPREVIEQTTKCPHQFCCVPSGKCGDSDMCEVDRVSGGNVLLVIERQKGGYCPYGFSFGDGHVCRCPVRLAIHTGQAH